MKKVNGNYKLVGGLLAGVIIGGVTVVGANQAIQAIQNTEIKVSLNGQVQTFKDETTGEVQYPITYHDRTYLPLRNVAQLAGLKVDYDSESNEAKLKEPLYLSRINSDDSGARDVFFFENYLCLLYTAPWGTIQSELHLVDDSGNDHVFGVYYDEENKKFMCEIDDDRLIVTEYIRDGIDESHYGMSRFYRRDYEIVLENGTIVENTISEDHTDIMYDAST